MPTPKGGTAWNSGKGNGWTDQRGYRWVYVLVNGRRVARRESRKIMEDHLERTLEPWEIVHHRDGNRSNNAIENLEVQEWGEHSTRHHMGKRRDSDARDSIAAFALMREELKRERAIKSELLEALKSVAACFSPDYESAIAAKVEQSEPEASMLKVYAAIRKAEGRP